jgi:hypothetical protein
MISPEMRKIASCSCGQLKVRVHGEPLGVGICHCLECQKRTGSVFASLATFARPFEVYGSATEYVRVGDQGTRFVFRFCPVCGSTVYKTEDGDDQTVSISLGTFADPSFAAPQVSVYTVRKHAWVHLPADIRTFDKDP